jgi:DNA repair protein RadC
MEHENTAGQDYPNSGHRRRLREKFLRAGFSSLNDYEVIELLLTLGTPRKDCKQSAKAAIKRFKSLRGVLEASPEELREIGSLGPVNTFGILFIRQVASEYLKEKAKERPVCNSSQAVYDYLCLSMRGLEVEVFKVLYLNSQNRLLDEEDVSKGTVNMTAVFTREVIKKAIQNQATALIFAHNHPSGNPSPSKQDREITRELIAAARLMQICVQDHIIIGDAGYFSFAKEGILNG